MAKNSPFHEYIDAIGVLDQDSKLHVSGNAKGAYRFASVTKLLTTYVIADAVLSEFISFDDWVPNDYFQHGQVSLADLLSHSSGIRPDGLEGVVPREKRIYTNEAFELAGTFLIDRLGDDFTKTTIGDLFSQGLGSHLGMTTTFEGSCAHSAHGTFDDLLLLIGEMRTPTFIDQKMHEKLVTPYLPELSGILPGWGNFEHNTFGIGFEVKGDKQPHWTGSKSSPKTYGHFGQSGAFVFHDPDNNISVACVTNQDFGPWAKEEFPKVCNLLYSDFT